MTFEVSVQPKSSRAFVTLGHNVLKVHLTRPAQDGEANAQLLTLLAAHFKVKKYQISIVRGMKSRRKLIRVDV